MTAHSFRNLAAAHRDTAKWPTLDLSTFGGEFRVRIDNLKAAIEAIFRDEISIRAAAEKFTLWPTTIARQIHRCLSDHEDGQIYGWRALAPKIRIKDYDRNAPASEDLGYTGAFSRFLGQHPDVRTGLIQYILKRQKDTVAESVVNMPGLFKHFKKLLQDAKVSADDYPLNTRTQAWYSVERFMKQVVNENLPAGIGALYGKKARSMLQLLTGKNVVQLPPQTMTRVLLDSHKIDCIGTVRIHNGGRLIDVPIRRLWITVMYLEEHRAILGYSVSIRQECNALAIEAAIESAMGTWEPRQLIVPGMAYAEGAGLPSGVVPGIAGAAWCELAVDNALVNLSKVITERVRERVGCAVEFGPIGHWETRSLIERVFKTLEGYGFQRLPSTTGSSPIDPKKDDPTATAVNLGLDYELLLDLVDVVVCNYNATRSEAVNFITPLDSLRNAMLASPPSFLPRKLPPPVFGVPQIGVEVVRRRIAGDPKKGRRPHVKIDRGLYTGPALAKQMSMIGQTIYVHLRTDDYRHGVAFHENGAEIGPVEVQGSWARTKHTLETRRTINSLLNDKSLLLARGEDPVQALMRYLAKGARTDADAKPTKVSADGTQLAKTLREADIDMPRIDEADPEFGSPGTAPTAPRPMPKAPSHLPAPNWGA